MSNKLIFSGSVIASDAGTYNVTIAPDGESNGTYKKGVYLPTLCSSIIGFKECFVPAVGSKVLCVDNGIDQCFVVGTQAGADQGTFTYPSRVAVQTGASAATDAQNRDGYGTDSTKMVTNNAHRPTDVLEGEWGCSNEFGVMVALFQQVALLKGSELSQIQCCLIDDLTRIISHNFEHFTGMSDLKISHDGNNLNLEYSLTHLPQEAIGIPQPDKTELASPIKETDTYTADDVDDGYTIENEQLQMVSRLKTFVGGLGDLINVYLSKPTLEYNIQDGTAPAPSLGLGHFHLGVNGAVHWRTSKEFFIEKTNWIRVPQRIRPEEDPQGNDLSTEEFDEKIDFTFDKAFTFNQEDPIILFLQLRDYLAYMYEDFNIKNLKKVDKDIFINSDKDEEESLDEVEEVDPRTPSTYTKTVSGIYLMDNGSIVQKDAWGSSIVMDGGNIYICPAKDLVVQSLRNTVIKSGQFTTICSNADLEISSTKGGLKLKTETAQHFYSNASGLILESNAQLDSENGQPYDQSVKNLSGILLKGEKSGVYTYGKNIGSRAISELVLSSKEHLAIQSKTAEIVTKNTLDLFSGQTANLKAGGSLSCIGQGTANFAGRGSSIFGKNGERITAQFNIIDGEGRNCSIVKQAWDGTGDTAAAAIAEANKNLQSDLLPIFKEDNEFTDLKFRFLHSDFYKWITGEDCLPQTMAQQQHTFLNDWEPDIWEEEEINESFPYPGKNNFDASLMPTSVVRNVDDENLNKVDDLQSSSTLVNKTLKQIEVVKL